MSKDSVQWLLQHQAKTIKSSQNLGRKWTSDLEQGFKGQFSSNEHPVFHTYPYITIHHCSCCSLVLAKSHIRPETSDTTWVQWFRWRSFGTWKTNGVKHKLNRLSMDFIGLPTGLSKNTWTHVLKFWTVIAYNITFKLYLYCLWWILYICYFK